MDVVNVWAIEYDHRGQHRVMLLEADSDYGYSEVDTLIHPSIKARPYSLMFVGEASSV